MSFSIVTDSASDILPEIRDQYNVFVVPTMVLFGNEEFDDGQITKEDFLDRLRHGQIPKTSQPSPNNYLKYYQEAMAASETQEVLGIHISSKLSGTFNGAVGTRNMIDDGSIRLVDSLNVSVGSGYLVYMATQLRTHGYSMEQTAQTLEIIRGDIHLQVVINNVHHLRRSGRINLPLFALLSMFGLKPLISVQDGILVRSGVAFGKKSGIRKAAKKILRQLDTTDDPIIYFGHANTPEDLPMIERQFSTIQFSREVDIAVCTTLMVHAGPGVVGILTGPSVERVLDYAV